MLNTRIHKKLAANAVVLLLVLLALATIRPMRLYTEDHVYSTTLEPERISEAVTEELDAGEYFTAQQDHLQTLEFYVDSVLSGTTARFQLFHVGDNNAMELVAQEDVVLPDEVPGYATAPVDADLVVGDTYVYTVRGLDGSSFTVGYESEEQAAQSGTAVSYQIGFYNDTGIDGVALKTRLFYRITLGTLPSIALAAAFLAAGVLAMKLIGLIFRKKPEWNTSITILQALQYVLTPVVLVIGAAGFIAVWPMKLFDSRILDILVYETGIVLGVLICLYALWHDRSGMPTVMNAHLFRVNVWHYGIILSIAAILHFSADYMNATSELGHNVAMHWIVFFLSVILILMGDTESNCSPPVFLTLITVPFGCLVYYLVCRVPASEEEAGLRNAVLASRAAAIAAVSLAAVSVIVMVVKRIQKARKAKAEGNTATAADNSAPSGEGTAAQGREAGRSAEGEGILPTRACRPLVIGIVILAGMLVIFRNTRLWILLLVAMWLMFYLRYQSWRGRGRLLQDLCEGILLDFGFKVVYSMLHRYYPAYTYSRFPMHFHTPTVTAYYLIVVSSAALTLFVLRWRQTQGQTLRRRLPRIWKEALALGMAGSYLMMTLTRSGIGTFLILCVIAAFCGAGFRLRNGASSLAAILLTVLLTFPVAFTGQRLISTAYAHPDIFEDVETYDDWLLRNTTWNCTRFMNIEIYIRDFGDRIIGGEVGSDLYYGLGWNIPQGYRTSRLPEETDFYEEAGLLAASDDTAAAGLLAASGDTAAEELSAGSGMEIAAAETESGGTETAAGLLLSDTSDIEIGSLDTGDISNGRLGLYLTYLRNLNLTGHDVMGVTLSNGETAVHAHNVVLQVAWDCGIPTGLVFLAVLLMLIAAAFRHVRSTAAAVPQPPAEGEEGAASYAVLPLLLTVGFAVIGMVEWNFHFSNPFTIALLFVIAPLLFRENG